MVYPYSDDSGPNVDPACHRVPGSVRPNFQLGSAHGAAPDGNTSASFTWTYDKPANRYLNVQRRLSRDEGRTWTCARRPGFCRSALASGAFLPDGGLCWPGSTASDRARSARAWRDVGSDRAVSAGIGNRHLGKPRPQRETGVHRRNARRYGVVEFRSLPFAETLPNGEVIVLYYAGGPGAMQVESGAAGTQNRGRAAGMNPAACVITSM